MRRAPRAPLLLAALLSGATGCASGPAEVEAVFDDELRVLSLHVTTEGKNTFTFGAHSCEAPRGGGCTLDIPAAELPGSGWTRVELETKRRTGMDDAPGARVYIGDRAFPRDCTVEDPGEVLDPDELVLSLRCTFPEGWHGELWGEALKDGRADVSAQKLTDPAASPDLDRAGGMTDEHRGVAAPLIVVEIPLEVVNRAGGRRARPVEVAVPAPIVQLAVDGWDDPWYELELPLRLRTEPNAELLVDGEPVAQPRPGREIEHVVKVREGANRVRIEARAPGRIPAVEVLSVEGRWPLTPLWIDEPRRDEFTTTAETVRVRGRVYPGSEVFLGRVPVQVDRRGRFVVDASLEEGLNDVEIVAVYANPREGVVRRSSGRSFRVLREPHKPTEKALAVLGEEPAEPEEAPLALEDVVGSTWEQVGKPVRFSMQVEEIDSFPAADGTCTARLEGPACSREVTRRVRLGFRTVQARACVGARSPVLVEVPSCPQAEAGSWLEVVGRVRGLLGGRVDGLTRERVHVEAERVAPAPRVPEREERG